MTASASSTSSAPYTTLTYPSKFTSRERTIIANAEGICKMREQINSTFAKDEINPFTGSSHFKKIGKLAHILKSLYAADARFEAKYAAYKAVAGAYAINENKYRKKEFSKRFEDITKVCGEISLNSAQVINILTKQL